MPLNKLRRTFEERRINLIEQLQKHKDELDISQQHQIYGAVKEIETFLKSIDHYRTLEAEHAFEMDLSQEREWPILRRTQRIIRKFGNGCTQVVVWTFWRGPIRLGKGVKVSMEARSERRELEKQVRREVENRLKMKHN